MKPNLTKRLNKKTASKVIVGTLAGTLLLGGLGVACNRDNTPIVEPPIVMETMTQVTQPPVIIETPTQPVVTPPIVEPEPSHFPFIKLAIINRPSNSKF